MCLEGAYIKNWLIGKSLSILSLRNRYVVLFILRRYSLLVCEANREERVEAYVGMNRVLCSMYVINLCHSYHKGRPLSRY